MLGLGDKNHAEYPSKLMLGNQGSKLLHIDLGNCLKASVHCTRLPKKACLLVAFLSRVRNIVLTGTPQLAVTLVKQAVRLPVMAATISRLK